MCPSQCNWIDHRQKERQFHACVCLCKSSISAYACPYHWSIRFLSFTKKNRFFWDITFVLQSLYILLGAVWCTAPLIWSSLKTGHPGPGLRVYGCFALGGFAPWTFCHQDSLSPGRFANQLHVLPRTVDVSPTVGKNCNFRKWKYFFDSNQIFLVTLFCISSEIKHTAPITVSLESF